MSAIHWKKAISGNFTTTADWNPASVPGAADDAIIDAIGAYTVTTSANETVNTLDTIAGATFSISAATTFEATAGAVNGGKIAIGNGSTFETSSVDNIGTISLNGSTLATNLEFNGAANIVGGNGKITLSNNVNNHIIADSNNRTFDNFADTISGAGRIGDVSDTHLTFVNDHAGVVNANGTKALTIETGNAVLNNGVMEATSTGGLKIGDTINQLGGTGIIKAVGAGAHVDLLNNSAIFGGTLTTSGGGQIETVAGAESSLLTSTTGILTNNGLLTINDSSSLNVTGTFLNNGTFAIHGSTLGAALVIAGDTVFAGSGHITLADSPKSLIISTSVDHALSFTNTISGAGTLGDLHIELINSGIVDATGKNALVVTGKTLTNNNLMEATGVGRLAIATDLTNNGTIQAAGTGHVELKDHVTIDNGSGVVSALKGGSIEIGSAASFASASIDGGLVSIAIGGQLITLLNKNQTTATDVTIDDGAVSNAGKISISDNSEIVFRGQTSVESVTNSGSILVNGAAKATSLVIDGAMGVTLNGGGKVTLTDNLHSAILTAGTATSLRNIDNVITGAGTFGDSHLTLTNDGIINANGKNALTINTFGNAIDNNGLIEVTGSGGLAIDSSIQNKGGEILAASKTGALTIHLSTVVNGIIETTTSGATIKLDDGTIIGSVTTVAGSTITTVTDTVDQLEGKSVNNAGSVKVVDDSILKIGSVLTNSGTISLASAGISTAIEVIDDLLLSGHGHLTLSDDVHNLIESGQSANTVTTASRTVNIGGSVATGDTIALTFSNTDFATTSVAFTAVAGATTADIAKGLAAAINDSTDLAALSIHATFGGSSILITEPGDLGTATTVTPSKFGVLGETLTATGTLTGGSGIPNHLENHDNTISGAGTIGDSSNFQLINDQDGVVNANGKHLLEISTGTNEVLNHGTMEATGLGGLKIDGAVLNDGHIIANNSKIEIDGSLTGFGGSTITGKGVLDLQGAFNLQDVTFAAGSKGELILAHSDGYSGRLYGFGANTTQSIDLADINFTMATTHTFTPSGSNIEGVLTVSDGTHTANITLVGHYLTGNFTLQDDNTGHVLVIDPPVHGHSDLLMH